MRLQTKKGETRYGNKKRMETVHSFFSNQIVFRIK